MSTYTSGLEARKKYKDYCKSVTIFSRFSSISGHLSGWLEQARAGKRASHVGPGAAVTAGRGELT